MNKILPLPLRSSQSSRGEKYLNNQILSSMISGEKKSSIYEVQKQPGERLSVKTDKRLHKVMMSKMKFKR